MANGSSPAPSRGVKHGPSRHKNGVSSGPSDSGRPTSTPRQPSSSRTGPSSSRHSGHPDGGGREGRGSHDGGRISHDGSAAGGVKAEPGSARVARTSSMPADGRGLDSASDGTAVVGADADAYPDPDPNSEAGLVRSLLCRAFCLFPRVVLAACIQPFRLPLKQREPSDCQARLALLGVLLQAQPQAEQDTLGQGNAAGVRGAAHGSAAVKQEGGGCKAAAGQELNGLPAISISQCGGTARPQCNGPMGRAPSSPCGQAQSPQGQEDAGAAAVDGCSCLAETVLSCLPDTQNWFKQVTAAFARASPAPLELQALLDRLLGFCTAPPSTGSGGHHGHGHGAGKTSPKASPEAVPHAGGAPGAAAAAAGAAPASAVKGSAPGAAAVVVKSEPAPAAAHSTLGSEEGSRSVPMDLDQSIGTVKQEHPAPGGSAAQHAAAAAAAAAAGATAPAPGPPDTAATPPPPPQLPQPPPHPHQVPQPSSPPWSAPAVHPAASPATAAAAAVMPGPPPLRPQQQAVLPGPPPPPSQPAAPTGLRGGAVCRAEACLYVGGLPVGVPEATLVAELGRSGTVESVHACDAAGSPVQLPAGPGGQAVCGEEVYVVFSSLRDAAICFEATAGTCRFGGSRPLHVEFCSAFPSDSPSGRRRAAAAATPGTAPNAVSAPSHFVWVSCSAAGPGAAAVTPEAAVSALQEAGAPVPQQILQVQGHAPGMLLHMGSPTLLPAVVNCLRSHLLPAPRPQPPSPPAAMQAGGAPGAAPQLSVAAAGGTPMHGQHSSQQQQQQPAPPMQGQAGGPFTAAHQHAAAAPLPPDVPPPNCRTLWIGQLHESVREEELLSVCRSHGGELVGYRFLRSSHCAFVDFATAAGADAARRVLHGLRLGPNQLRVEWKLQQQQQMDQMAAMRMAGPRRTASATPPGPATTPGGVPMPGGMATTPGVTPGMTTAPAGAPLQPATGASGVRRDASGMPYRDRWAPVAVPPPHPPPPPPPQHTPYGGAGARQHGTPQHTPAAQQPPQQPTPFTHPGAQHSAQASMSSQPPPPPPPLQQHAQASQAPGQQHSHHHHPGAPPPHPDWPGPQALAPGGGSALAPAMSLMGMDSGPAPPLPNTPPPPPPEAGAQQASAATTAAAAAAVVTWQGTLAKSGSQMCALQCTSGGASVAAGATPGEREPVGWPATLDVKLRVDLSYVVNASRHTPPHSRALRRLQPVGGPDQRNRLSEFLEYLAEKNRAGVIKLEAAAGLPARTLYLVPPAEATCAALGAGELWAQAAARREQFLLAVVVPASGAGGGRS